MATRQRSIADDGAGTSVPDGRRLRRQQNREAVLDALMEIFAEGVYQPRAHEVAERAGLSPRSLFRYFDDVDDLSRAAIGRQQRRARELLDPGVGPGAPTATKIERLVEARARMFDAIGPAARAARVCAHRHPVVAAELREGRAQLRKQVSTLFARELEGDRDAVLPAIDALCSFETYELLRHDQGLSRPKTVGALVHALRSLLDPEGATS